MGEHKQYDIQMNPRIRQPTTSAGISQLVVHERTFIMQDQSGVILCEFALIIEASQNGLMHSRHNEGKYEMHKHIQIILPCENAHSVLVQIVKMISSWMSR